MCGIIPLIARVFVSSETNPERCFLPPEGSLIRSADVVLLVFHPLPVCFIRWIVSTNDDFSTSRPRKSGAMYVPTGIGNQLLLLDRPLFHRYPRG